MIYLIYILWKLSTYSESYRPDNERKQQIAVAIYTIVLSSISLLLLGIWIVENIGYEESWSLSFIMIQLAFILFYVDIVITSILLFRFVAHYSDTWLLPFLEFIIQLWLFVIMIRISNGVMFINEINFQTLVDIAFSINMINYTFFSLFIMILPWILCAWLILILNRNSNAQSEDDDHNYFPRNRWINRGQLIQNPLPDRMQVRGLEEDPFLEVQNVQRDNEENLFQNLNHGIDEQLREGNIVNISNNLGPREDLLLPSQEGEDIISVSKSHKTVKIFICVNFNKFWNN